MCARKSKAFCRAARTTSWKPKTEARSRASHFSKAQGHPPSEIPSSMLLHVPSTLRSLRGEVGTMCLSVAIDRFDQASSRTEPN